MAKGTPRDFESYSGDLRREIKSDLHWAIGTLVTIFLAAFLAAFGFLFAYIRSIDEKVNRVENKLSTWEGKMSSTTSLPNIRR